MERPRALLLDDGELGRVYVTLRRMGLAPMRVSGDDILDGLPMPSDLLVTTGRRTLSAPELAVTGSGAPVWICVHTQDFHPLRERLRSLGVHYLVQSSSSDASLELFFSQLLHGGSERRTEPRIPVGCEVRWSWRSRTPNKGVLLDLTTHCLRIGMADEIPVGARLEITLPAELTGDDLTIGATVDRCDPMEANGASRWDAALRWDALEPGDRERIDGLATGQRIGTRITPLKPRPYRDGTGIPDWEEMARSGDRRSNPRHRYDGHVDAFAKHAGTGPIATLGRDLSARGMRVDPSEGLDVGRELTVAIHAGEQSEPILVDARVERRHPDGTLGLVFTLLDKAQRSAIERVLESLPGVALLSADERILPTELTPR